FRRILTLDSFLLSRSRHHPALPSFPTRRSSDLDRRNSTSRLFQSMSPHSNASCSPARAPVCTAKRRSVRSSSSRVESKSFSDSSDRKSTRLNSSHLGISYAVFCLKKKKKNTKTQ